MVDPRMYWVGFNMVKGIGSVRFKALLDRFGNAETAWNASPEALVEVGLSQKIIESFQRVRKGVSLEQIWERIQSLGVHVLTWDDEGYPRHLKEIDQPPPVLYIRGSLLAGGRMGGCHRWYPACHLLWAPGSRGSRHHISTEWCDHCQRFGAWVWIRLPTRPP